MARHAAIEDFTPDGRLCRVCGGAVIGAGPTLRHDGETLPVTVPDRQDARALAAAVADTRAVLRRLPPETPRDELARIVAETLYASGWLRRRRGDRHRFAGDLPERTRDIYEVEDPAERGLATVA